ncbi:MAG: toxin-antitoxin system protein [Lachnospiraceae bacterium]|nr:toxin-antitoxin system protein [Lachnospiraceae bacterium]
MNVINAEYNTHHYLLQIDCWEAEKRLKTTPGSEYVLNTLAIDEPLEYACLYLEGNM